jgi:hypothetical protein
LLKTLYRWYSTVRGLRKSRLAIWGFESPSLASRAICVSCGLDDLGFATLNRGKRQRAVRPKLAPGRFRHRFDLLDKRRRRVQVPA